jgi:hypothetical protein
MKFKTILLIAICGFTTHIFAQNDEKALRADVDKYVTAVQTSDIETTLDYLYPKFYDVAPRELIKGFLEKSAEGIADMTIQNSKIGTITPIIQTDTNYHALVDYSFEMVMPLDNKDEKEEGQNDEEFSEDNFIAESMKAQYGEDNVKYNEDKTALIINVSNKMLAIKTAIFPTWTFITYSDAQKPVLEKIVPENILKNYQ